MWKIWIWVRSYWIAVTILILLLKLGHNTAQKDGQDCKYDRIWPYRLADILIVLIQPEVTVICQWGLIRNYSKDYGVEFMKQLQIFCVLVAVIL